MERAATPVGRARASRWAGVGRSAHRDAAAAGREAARDALAGRQDAGLLLVLASDAHDLAVLGAAVDGVAAGVPVAGCSALGDLGRDGPATDAVTVLALGGDGLSVATAAVAGAGPRDAGARAAACLGDVADRPHRVLLLLADGEPTHHADVVRGAYSVAGAGVPLVGAVAGGPGRAARGPGPAVLHGAAALHGAVVGIAIGSDAPLGVGARHGWRPVGEPMLVTDAAPGRILALDERPAAEVYRERMRRVSASGDDVLAHPLGFRRRLGEPHVRAVDLDGASDGSIRCPIPAGALVWLMASDPAAVLDAADAACGEAVAALGGADPAALLVFDCAARLQFLDRHEGAAVEAVARAAAHAGTGALAGAFTYGEIARTRGVVGFHHQTLVALAVG